MASQCRAIVPLGACVCVSCASTSTQKAWGAHRVIAGEGGDEIPGDQQVEPVLPPVPSYHNSRLTDCVSRLVAVKLAIGNDA